MFDDLWDGFTESLGETWDVVLETGKGVIAETLQKTKETGVDTTQLKASEPLKGTNPDGSTIVVEKQTTGNAVITSTQLINGVDNKLVYVGGAVAGFLMLLLVIKAVK
ncbi:hypothetical protein [Thalassotalea profundi]|uniref:Uncharacterized protein n=1 Tax=Thalassotalea profundi TaxID=2036687 RepID=A0ABQ3ILU0_9GAMM|nr:hypothetical protein [Thalassotalea profundi]GHE87447.1 hypothetical protein GCM10011501_16150 [Thalassotalea profundi]